MKYFGEGEQMANLRRNYGYGLHQGGIQAGASDRKSTD